MNSLKTASKTYLTIGSLIFGMIFGAGNLVFPVHLGQLAGHNWLPAAIGFIVSGVFLPLFALLAISITRSRGLFELALPVGRAEMPGLATAARMETPGVLPGHMDPGRTPMSRQKRLQVHGQARQNVLRLQIISAVRECLRRK